MGDLFDAYAFLNTSLKLGLTGDQILAMEQAFKSAYAAKTNPNAMREGAARLTENWELRTTLVRRSRSMRLQDLSRLARISAQSLRYPAR